MHFTVLDLQVLAAIAAASAFSQFDGNHVIGGWISICMATVSGLATFLNPNEKAASHYTAANNYDALHNKARIFWTVDCNGNGSDEVITNRLERFNKSYSHKKQTSQERLEG